MLAFSIGFLVAPHSQINRPVLVLPGRACEKASNLTKWPAYISRRAVWAPVIWSSTKVDHASAPASRFIHHPLRFWCFHILQALHRFRTDIKLVDWKIWKNRERIWSYSQRLFVMQVPYSTLQERCGTRLSPHSHWLFQRSFLVTPHTSLNGWLLAMPQQMREEVSRTSNR